MGGDMLKKSMKLMTLAMALVSAFCFMTGCGGSSRIRRPQGRSAVSRQFFRVHERRSEHRDRKLSEKTLFKLKGD